jgi:ferredoxin
LVHQAAVAHAVLEGLGYDRRMMRIVRPGETGDLISSLEDDLPDAWVDEAASFDAFSDKRAALKLALMHLVQRAPRQPDEIMLPVDAPFGEVRVDPAKCTLCMSCVAACPTSALKASENGAACSAVFATTPAQRTPSP